MASAAALTASAALKARIRRPSLLKKLAHPEDLIPLFPNGAYIGWSGFTGVGYPKYVSIARSAGQLSSRGSSGPCRALCKESNSNTRAIERSQLCSRTMSKRTTCKAS